MTTVFVIREKIKSISCVKNWYYILVKYIRIGRTSKCSKQENISLHIIYIYFFIYLFRFLHYITATIYSITTFTFFRNGIFPTNKNSLGSVHWQGFLVSLSRKHDINPIKFRYTRPSSFESPCVFPQYTEVTCVVSLFLFIFFSNW